MYRLTECSLLPQHLNSYHSKLDMYTCYIILANATVPDTLHNYYQASKVYLYYFKQDDVYKLKIINQNF